jgi:hypothetical protein
MSALETEPPGEIRAATTSLFQKLAAAAKEIGTVEKDKRNTFHKYDYASIEAIADATRDVLLAHGILVLAGEEETDDRQRQTNQGEATVTTIKLTFRLVDVDTGESLSIPWIGRGEDPADKGVAKALTDARKTFLIQQFNLVRGEDTEADESTDQRTAAPKGTVNLSDLAKGMTNAQLNAALVAAGLSAAEKPWGTFMRIPTESAEAVKTMLSRERAQ